MNSATGVRIGTVAGGGGAVGAEGVSMIVVLSSELIIDVFELSSTDLFTTPTL